MLYKENTLPLRRECLRKRERIIEVGVLSISHLLVDFASVYFVFQKYANTSFSLAGMPWVFLLYNFLAFSLQLPLGIVGDTLKDKGRLELWRWAFVAALVGLPCWG